MTSGRKLGIATIALAGTLGLSALVAPQSASPTHKEGLDRDGEQAVRMTLRVKQVNVSRTEEGQQDVLKGDGRPFGKVTINYLTPAEDIGDDEKRVSFTLFPWRGHRGRVVSGWIPVKNTIIDATPSWQKERVKLNDNPGYFRESECTLADRICDPETKINEYSGVIERFSGVLKCYYATRTCTGTIDFRGQFEPFVKD